ncbi:MAG: hypothetical protein Greene101449_916 [Candidatus Peregrinibacteria bacterium Greene1014_49]|nr:MAG: hypothetical protein Greene101449_916 [Candidatus Peregrinibacteria bacterium Greene1014_49]
MILPFHQYLKIPLINLHLFARRIPFIERREYSQNGEDGVIAAIFAMIGTTNRTYVEFGVEDGIECNTRYLFKHKGWKGLLMDGSHTNPSLNLHQEFITAENIEQLFVKYSVPKDFDLLSVDIDGNDYWVWKAITHNSPRVVIMEYNACIPYEPPVTVPYDPAFAWDKTDYYGASLSALVSLARAKGYTLVGTDPNGVNAFFVRDDCITGNFHIQNPRSIYRPAAFKGKSGNAHPRDTLGRLWVTVGRS